MSDVTISGVTVTELDSCSKDGKELKLLKYENSHGEKFYRVQYRFNNGGSGESMPVSLYSDAKRYYSFAKGIIIS